MKKFLFLMLAMAFSCLAAPPLVKNEFSTNAQASLPIRSSVFTSANSLNFSSNMVVAVSPVAALVGSDYVQVYSNVYVSSVLSATVKWVVWRKESDHDQHVSYGDPNWVDGYTSTSNTWSYGLSNDTALASRFIAQDFLSPLPSTLIFDWSLNSGSGAFANTLFSYNKTTYPILTNATPFIFQSKGVPIPTYYVNSNPSVGDDLKDGQTPESALRTVGRLFTISPAPTNVFLAVGSYDPMYLVPVGLPGVTNIHIKGAGRGFTYLRGSIAMIATNDTIVEDLSFDGQFGASCSSNHAVQFRRVDCVSEGIEDCYIGGEVRGNFIIEDSKLQSTFDTETGTLYSRNGTFTFKNCELRSIAPSGNNQVRGFNISSTNCTWNIIGGSITISNAQAGAPGATNCVFGISGTGNIINIAGTLIQTNGCSTASMFNVIPGSTYTLNVLDPTATILRPLIAQIYSGRTNISSIATSLTIAIGRTMSSTNYTPSASFLGAALAAASTPTFSGLTTTNFVMNLSVALGANDDVAWSVIYSP